MNDAHQQSPTRKKHDHHRVDAESNPYSKASPDPGSSLRPYTSTRMRQLGKEIEQLYNLQLDFKFKSLRPWVVLSAGDVIQGQQLMKVCEKQGENTKHDCRLMKPPGPPSAEEIELIGSRSKSRHPNGEETNETPEQEFQWPTSLCSVDSLGNLYAIDNQTHE